MTEPLWLTAFRDITNSTNERTVISSALGPYAVGNKAPIYDISPKVAAAAAMLLANFDCIALDWTARFSVGGTNLNYFIVKQLPVLGPETFLEEAQPRQTYAELIATRVLELTYTAWDLEPFAHDLGYNGPPFKWDEQRRFLIRCELDAAFFHLYLGSEAQWKATGSKELSAYFPTPRHAVEYIMESFPIVKRKDEQAHGRYRTKDAILEIYDRLAEVSQANAAAVVAGQQPSARYQTAVTPPPGPPTDAAGNFIPIAQWNEWPAHIHLPNEHAIAEPIAAPVVMTTPRLTDIEAMVQAFVETRDGRSPDFVVADPITNANYRTRAKQLGLNWKDSDLNRWLLNARKTSQLSRLPTEREYRLDANYEPWIFASEWGAREAIRRLTDRDGQVWSLDDILCDPSASALFDEIVEKIKPGFARVDMRWAALSFRKRSTARKAGKQLRSNIDGQQTMNSLLGLPPAKSGVYRIVAGEMPLFVNFAKRLDLAIGNHRDLAGDEYVPQWLRRAQRAIPTISWEESIVLDDGTTLDDEIDTRKPWLNLLPTG